jgi:alpha-L-rhamnosidase
MNGMLIVHRLTCESPLTPRFSWMIETDIPDAVQHSYRIEVIHANETVWDSGEVQSDRSVFAEYAGPPLAYAARYFWRVKVLVNGICSEWSEPAQFETELKTWSAPFIRADDTPEESCAKIFRKDITVEQPLRSARMYATALGLYDVRINGKPVSDTCFDPGWTAYDSRVLYQTYDITALLADGVNTVTATVGAGWYKGDLGHWNGRGLYGGTMAFSARIGITYADGNEETILTGEDWLFSDSPILYSEIYHGETYDARREDPTDWHAAVLHTEYRGAVEPFDGVPVRRQEVLSPVAFLITPKGERVLDFGQNLTGRVRFCVTGNRGDTVRLRHAEVLDREGNFYTENLRGARCTDTYILKGGEAERYEPLFTFHGFRYVCIDEYPGVIDPGVFEAVVLHSDMERTGTFACSHPLINKLQSNITWGLKGNFLDIPTDCPQRDERLGWTGDAQIFAPTACFLYNVLPFFRKWLRDLLLDRRPDGGVPYVIPDVIRKDGSGQEKHSACGWGDAAVIIPWTLYECYGSVRILEEQYDSMKGWVDYIRSQAEDGLWNKGFHFADWVALDAKEGERIGATPPYLCATAYYAYSAGLLAKTAKVLGKDDDAELYQKLRSEITESYKNEFFTKDGQLTARTQTAHILSLVFDLTPRAFIPRTTDTLVTLIEENGGHFVTGFLGTPYFCRALSQNGKLAEAYALLQREEYPSWLYQVKMGATTVWEHLDSIKPDGTMWSSSMNSFNHYAYGAVGDWLYRTVAGINPLEPGYKKIRIEPNPGGTLTWAEASLKTPYGTVAVRWELDDGKFTMDVTVPPNTTAEIVLPGGVRYQTGSGRHKI